MINTTFLQNIHKRLFYLLILTLPTQLGLHFWPSWALVLGRRVDYLSPTLFATDILILLLLLFWGIGSATGTKKKTVQIHSPFILFSTILLLFALLNIWVAASRPVAIYTWVKLFEFVALGFYIVKTKPDLGRVIFFLSISALYSSLIAVVQFVLQHSVGGILWFLGERTFTAATPGIAQIPLCLSWAVSCPLALRPYATFPHPNVLGGFLAVTLPLILVSMCQRVNASAQKKARIFCVMTFIAGFIALVLTFSRSAWAIGVLGIGSMYFVLGRPRKFIPIGVTLLAASFMLLITVSIHSESESVVVRQQLAVSAIKIWQTVPFTGVGLGNFLVALPRFIPSRTIYFLQPVHNIYLLLLSEAGIVGLGLFGWILWKILRHETRDPRHDETNKILVACRMSLVALLALGLIDHYPLSLQQGRLLLTLLIG